MIRSSVDSRQLSVASQFKATSLGKFTTYIFHSSKMVLRAVLWFLAARWGFASGKSVQSDIDGGDVVQVGDGAATISEICGKSGESCKNKSCKCGKYCSCDSMTFVTFTTIGAC
ncbi:MAG: hypothetical protein GC179_30035 [Anaerolineaceae bacterium]|nr:hypothetical protein [Anaerolineaceae bacterium]